MSNTLSAQTTSPFNDEFLKLSSISNEVFNHEKELKEIRSKISKSFSEIDKMLAAKLPVTNPNLANSISEATDLARLEKDTFENLLNRRTDRAYSALVLNQIANSERQKERAVIIDALAVGPYRSARSILEGILSAFETSEMRLAESIAATEHADKVQLMIEHTQAVKVVSELVEEYAFKKNSGKGLALLAINDTEWLLANSRAYRLAVLDAEKLYKKTYGIILEKRTAALKNRLAQESQSDKDRVSDEQIDLIHDKLNHYRV